jgi:hypothetical protein
MENEAYLDLIGVEDQQARMRCLEAMSKYGNNHWWEPDVEPRTYAYYAIKEPIHLDAATNSSRMGRGLMELLDRDVHPWETVTNKTALLQEVERAWTYGVGCTSDTERDERVHKGALSILDYMQQQ